jgi:hypothetical protein
MLNAIDNIIDQTPVLVTEQEPAILSYSDAVQIRTYAETYADPYYFRMAAMAFDSLDMPYAACRCRARAEHYEVKS